MKLEVQSKYDSYPKSIKELLLSLRELVYEVAEDQNIEDLEEALKWGEPSFLSRGGSTIRIDWKERTPENYYMYFNCQSKLVETFRELYKDELRFEGKRAIIFDVNQDIPREKIKHCVSLALRYKSLKHLDLLGE